MIQLQVVPQRSNGFLSLKQQVTLFEAVPQLLRPDGVSATPRDRSFEVDDANAEKRERPLFQKLALREASQMVRTGKSSVLGTPSTTVVWYASGIRYKCSEEHSVVIPTAGGDQD